MLTAKDIRGVYSIMTTPAKSTNGRWNGEDTIDHEESVRIVNALIDDGSDGLIILGTTGECPTITEEEYKSFVRTVIEATRKRVPLFVGATTLSTRETIRRLEYARGLGADGTLLGMPMWQPVTEEIAIRYYASISEALPDFPIMVYANEFAFRFDFPPSFWAGLVKRAPTVIAAKYATPHKYLACLKACEGKINLLPFPELIRPFVKLSPESVTAMWTTSASMGPTPIVAMMDALKRKDMTQFDKIAGEIAWTNEPLMKPDGIWAAGEFPHYNIQFEKMRREAAGYCKVGPCRPPYDYMPEKWAVDARENGRRWAEICQRYPAPR